MKQTAKVGKISRKQSTISSSFLERVLQDTANKGDMVREAGAG